MFGLIKSLAKETFSARKVKPRSRPTSPRRFKPTLEGLEDRLMPSLTAVPANTIHPYTAVAEVEVTFPNGGTFVGSGAMIDSFHVLTAAHMLYNPAEGGWARSIRVIPDMNYSSEPYGVAWGTYERVDPTWVSNPNPGGGSEDIGLVTLNTAIGYKTGWFGFGYNSNNAFFTNQYFETAGYPASNGYNGQQMYYSFGKITGESGDDLLSTEGNITNIPGQSGSPLWYTNGNIIYGVNSAWRGSTSSGSQDFFARITQSVFNELQSWRNSDVAPTSETMATAHVSAGMNASLTLNAPFGGTLESSALGRRVDFDQFAMGGRRERDAARRRRGGHHRPGRHGR